MANRNVLTSGINLPIEIVHSYPMSPPPSLPPSPLLKGAYSPVENGLRERAFR